ncbi:MAG TPA: hypothetical protein PLR25_01760 [Planctomycetaceae bacterium]|nr:hypothetical protein [Planctomycetaceae bacterium]
MSVATLRSAQTLNRLMPVLTPLYNARHESFFAHVDGTYRCGTEAESEFCLEYPEAEPAHCVFERRGASFFVTRLNGGVWVNDVPVRGRSQLREGNVITLGPVSFVLSFEEATSHQSSRHFHPPTTTGELHSPAHVAATTSLCDSTPTDTEAERDFTAELREHYALESAAQLQASKELEEQRKLLSLRQQQFDDLLQTVRERERNAESRLVAIEERSLQVSTQWNELLQKQQQLVTHEGELVQCSQGVQQQLRELAEKQQQSLQAAEERTLSSQALEQTRRQLAIQEQTLAEREKAFAEAERKSAARAASAATAAATASAAAVNAAAETRSVEQMTAIAAQREAAVRERQLAMQAQTELRELKEAVAAQQQELTAQRQEFTSQQQAFTASRRDLNQRQAELEARGNEVSSRLQSLKAFHRSQRVAAPAAAPAAADSETAAQQDLADALDRRSESLKTERDELDRRLAELAAREARLTETQNAATAKVQAAESERSALQNANKDLLCERNSLSQLRQDLASREAGIAEREVQVAYQLEEMRSRFAVLEKRGADLQHHESEIDTRAADVHRRVQQLKSDQQAHAETIQRAAAEAASAEAASAQAAITQTSTTDKDEELTSVRRQLEEFQRNLATQTDEHTSLVSERESLLSAVCDLQKALKDARQDVEDANRVKSEAALQQQRLEQAWQTIEEHTGSLQLNESTLRKVNQTVAELEETLRTRDDEIQRLSQSVQETVLADPSVQVPDEQEVKELRLAQERLQSQLEDAEELVQQRDDLIRELRDKLTQKDQAPATALNSEPINLMSRELDGRAELLDRRDEDLRERSRQIEQSESDVESQRRQLLQARQQLELARAEIQVAMRQQSDPDRRPVAPESNDTFAGGASAARNSEQPSSSASNQTGHSEEPDADNESAGPSTDLRSELAGLFGLRKPTAESSSPPPLPQSKSEFVDLSEPGGDQSALVLHFGANAAQIVETVSGTKPSAEPEPEREENSDDFVRDYMEQLLSRNRKSAGNALPGELKVQDKKPKPAPAPAEKPAVKSGPKVTSFIEQYMAGNMGNLDSGDALSMTGDADEAESTDTVAASDQPAQNRQKMDLQKLKENMESFRALSTQSVEKALATHANRIKNHGTTSRISYAVVLMVLTLALGIAYAWDMIESPLIMWVTLTSAIGILSELNRRYSASANRSSTTCEPQNSNPEASAKTSQKTGITAAEVTADEVTATAEDDYHQAKADHPKTLIAPDETSGKKVVRQFGEVVIEDLSEFTSSSRLT